MIVVSQNKRCAVEVQSIRLVSDVRPVLSSNVCTNVHMGYDIYANETIHVAKYNSEARAQQEFRDLLHRWAEGVAKWYWMPQDTTSQKNSSLNEEEEALRRE